MGQVSSTNAKQLFKAAKQDKHDVVADLVGRNVSLVAATDWLGGQSLWHVAAMNGHLNVMKAAESALSQGPTGSAVEVVQLPSSCVACRGKGKGPDHWKPLLRLGHSLQSIMEHVVNQVDSRIRTPLHYACMNGHADCAAFLLDLGADPWIGDMLGSRTCLHYAAAAGHPDCIKAVLSKCPGPHPQASPERPNRPDTQLVDVRNGAGFAPLHYAVWASHADAVQALLSFDAYLFPRNLLSTGDWIVCPDGCTPLHLAAMKGNIDVAKVLLKAYAECMVLDDSTGPTGGTSRHRTNLPDPRLVLNACNQLAFQVAQRLNNQAMAEILHPSIPFAFLFSSSDFHADTRLFGPCRLAVLAANALQQKLKHDIEAAAVLLQQHDALLSPLPSPGSHASVPIKPTLTGPWGSCDLNSGLDQGPHTHAHSPPSPPPGPSSKAEAANAEAKESRETRESREVKESMQARENREAKESRGQPASPEQASNKDSKGHGPQGVLSDPSVLVASPFRMDNEGMAAMMRSWGVPADSTLPPQATTGRNAVREVDAQLRVRGSSRRHLLSLGSMDRLSAAAATAAEEEVPVTQAVEIQSQFSLQETLPFISGRLGGNKEAFRQQFRLLRLTAGVQQANWQMGHSLLPPQRARSAPRPLPLLHPILKRTNTDSPATLRALSVSDSNGSLPSHPGAPSPYSHLSSRQLPSVGEPTRGRPPLPGPCMTTMQANNHNGGDAHAEQTEAAGASAFPVAANGFAAAANTVGPATRAPGTAQGAGNGEGRVGTVPEAGTEGAMVAKGEGLGALRGRATAADCDSQGAVGAGGESELTRAGEGRLAENGLARRVSKPVLNFEAGVVLHPVTVQFDLEDEEEEGEDDMCEICMDKPLQLSISSCGHRLCVDCASEMCKLHHFRPALCPFCRSIITGFKAYGIAH